MPNQVYLKALIISLLLGIFLLAGSLVFGMAEFPRTPMRASDFTLTDINGKSYTLSDFKNKIVVLNFWASWCPPCREEMPSIQKMYISWDQSKYVLLTVNVSEGREKVKEFAQKNGYTFPMLIDLGSKVSRKYEIRSIPTTYLIDEKGRILSKVVGSREWSEKEVQSIIKK